jgi:hypothetical protein
MTEVIEFPFKNVLNQKIDTVTSDMLMAILASQSNQDFFHTIINKGSHLFQHRQLGEEPYWYDLIKVYVGVPAADTFIVGIDESDELSEKITAVPFGLLAEIAEISDVMIPISLPIDQAAVLDGEGVTGFGGAVICYYAIKYSEKQRGKPELTLISVLYSIGGLLMIFLGIAESYSKGETLWLLLVALGIIHLLLGRWAYENVHDQIVK